MTEETLEPVPTRQFKLGPKGEVVRLKPGTTLTLRFGTNKGPNSEAKEVKIIRHNNGEIGIEVPVFEKGKFQHYIEVGLGSGPFTFDLVAVHREQTRLDKEPVSIMPGLQEASRIELHIPNQGVGRIAHMSIDPSFSIVGLSPGFSMQKATDTLIGDKGVAVPSRIKVFGEVTTQQ